MKLLVWIGVSLLVACAPIAEEHEREVEVKMEALISTYVKINSNGGSPLCSIVNQQCVVGSASARVFSAVRSLAQTRRPNGGVNYWTCPGASAQESTCRHDPESVWLHHCAGTAPIECEFGSGPVIEGSVRIAGDGRSAQWFFDNGGTGSSNFAGHSFFYDGP